LGFRPEQGLYVLDGSFFLLATLGDSAGSYS
jgi:hypothetical protein